MSAIVKQPVAAPSGWQIMKMLEIAIQHLEQRDRDITGDQVTEEQDEVLDTDIDELLALLKNKGSDVAGIMTALLLAGDEGKREAMMLAERGKRIALRRQRRLNKERNCRNAALQIMLTLPELFPEGKFRAPLVDAQARPGRLITAVTDETKIPERFFVVTRTLDKNMLNEAVTKDGEVVDGAELRNGAPFLVVKVT
jgi:hypothetical protein